MLTVVWLCHIISMVRPSVQFKTLVLLGKSILFDVRPSLGKAKTCLVWVNIAVPNFGKALVSLLGKLQGFQSELQLGVNTLRILS